MEIRPFRAYRFDESVVGDVGSCIAPPYDVISSDQQGQFYQKSEHNIIRIIKGKAKPSDNNGDNVYTRAAQYLTAWIDQGALKQDAREAIYGYVQDFDALGRRFQRLTFIALGKLEDFGRTVMAHEQIMHEPIVDRLNLKRATRARFGLVFMLYDDDKGVADRIIESAAERKPLIDFVDENGVRHRLFDITDKNDIDAIAEMMRDKSCIIADGHHRYTTGLLYSKENPSPAARYQMLAFTNTRHEGLVVLATHRVVSNLEAFDFPQLIEKLKTNFELTQYRFDSPPSRTDAKEKMLAQMRAEHDNNSNAFGIYGGDGSFYVAVLKNARAMDTAAPEKSLAWRSLDVSVLHKLILEQLLGIGEKQLAEGRYLEYVKDNISAIDNLATRVEAGQKQAVFFMNPTKVEQIQMVAEHGERMPQKSTYFYPKVYTGLTINKL
ncbi:MAG TPA: DUF1015 domain-containing protein [Sedimentisphaerales bacterium]|nr:DUF1015 domain-containing protein [Sedimentisphaerales bacterium]